MFLRVVRAASGKSGIKHEYVRVVEAYRDHEGKTRHQTIINLGRKDLLATHLDLDKLGRLLHGDKPGKPSVEGDDVGAVGAWDWGPMLVATHLWRELGLAWISTGPDLPNMVLGQTAHFRALSLRNYYAKWCADSPIAQRLLAQRSRDSGQFRSLLDEEMLGAGLHQRTNWPTSYSKILESRESVSVSDVREFSFRGNPGYRAGKAR